MNAHRRGSCGVGPVLGGLTVALCMAGAALAGEPAGGEWPQFRGPGRDGTASAAGLATAWPASGPVELWRRTIGAGFSAVTVVGDRLFTLGVDSGEEAVLAFAAADGKPLWRTALGKPFVLEFGDGARSTPTVQDGRLYVVSSSSRLVALDVATGKVIWERDLTAYDAVPRYGYAMSPLVVDGLVVVEVGTKDLVDKAKAEAAAKAGPNPAPTPDASVDPAAAAAAQPRPIGAVAAFDAKTGELRWRGGFPGPPSYASPVVAELAGVRQLVFSRGTRVAGLALDGTLLWDYETIPRSAIAIPVILPGDVVFVSTSDDAFGSLALSVRRDAAGQWKVEPLWSERLMRNHFNASVRVGNEIYGFDNGTFRCLDSKTGARRWAARGFGKGSLIAAGDLLFVIGDEGTLALVRATPESYQELGRVRALSGATKAWTAPSLAGGKLYLRDHQELVAYDVRQSALASAAAAAPASASGPATSPAARAAATTPDALGVGEIVQHYAAARGGAERWKQVRSLELSGTYRAFSERSDFTLLRLRAEPTDLFRLEYSVAGGPATRAWDEKGAWLRHKFLSPTPLHVAGDKDMATYEPQMRREAVFAPLLLDPATRGITVEKAGSGEVNGTTTIALKVTIPGAAGAAPAVETWHLDPRTFLEVAVDSQVLDYTQGDKPYAQRAYYGDFRTVDGITLPFRVELEFNARVEIMEVAKAAVNAPLDRSRFAPPPKP
ncbi:MAG: PQQ-binding-like beta-propeller repeat protein [Vicinamibacteria bacterium]|nr:PQQ-binding-like beta-propeller repeat protein [Vicinamibacteria bacterium]